MDPNPSRCVAIFGHFYSWMGNYKAPCEELSEKLESKHWGVVRASRHVNKVVKLVDMIRTAWKQRTFYNVAVVEIYSGLAFIWAEAVCTTLKLARKPYVLALHGGNLPEFSKRWPGRVKRLLKTASKVTVPSRYLFEAMRPFREDLVLIPNSISVELYPFRLRNKVSPILIWLRAFKSIYNPSLAPKVLHMLAGWGFDVRLKMVGPDKGDGSFQQTKQLAKKLGIIDRIQFPGGIPKSEVPACLQPYDIFINTTNFDNAPISVIEAVACGLCVVSTNVGGISYLLNDGQDALLVPPDDHEAMAIAIRRLLTEPGLAERLSQNARKKAEQLDWWVHLPQWEALLTSAEQRREG